MCSSGAGNEIAAHDLDAVGAGAPFECLVETDGREAHLSPRSADPVGQRDHARRRLGADRPGAAGRHRDGVLAEATGDDVRAIGYFRDENQIQGLINSFNKEKNNEVKAMHILFMEELSGFFPEAATFFSTLIQKLEKMQTMGREKLEGLLEEMAASMDQDVQKESDKIDQAVEELRTERQQPSLV